MIRHFFLDKTNTIVEGSKYNLGLNPILHLSFGSRITRGLLHFDKEEIDDFITENAVNNTGKLHFNLKMTNCVSLNGMHINNELKTDNGVRAASFDLMLVKLPCEWDMGVGYDCNEVFWDNNDRAYSTQGSSWYISSGQTKWDMNGVYTSEYVKQNPNLIVGKQHFDYGNEDLNIDITDYILNSASTNYGFMLMFEPTIEQNTQNEEKYYFVDFFTQHTNTFYHPYIEMNYDEPIMDDREAFYIGKENKLYLYSNIGGVPCNLDALPTCSVNDTTYEVKQAQKGVYFAVISLSKEEMTPNTILYDKWSNLALNGQEIEDIEMEFVALPQERYYRIGEETAFKDMVAPSIYGINDAENVGRGEIREIVVDFRKKYTTDKKLLNINAKYRLYVKDGERERDVIPYTQIEKSFLNNFFMIYTDDLVPNKYFVDVMINEGRTTRYYKDVLHFNIVNNITKL